MELNGPNSRTKFWRRTNLVALLVLIVWCYYYGTQVPKGTWISGYLAAYVTLVFISLGAEAIYSGSFAANGYEFKRDEHPFAFWLMVIGTFAISARIAFLI